MILSGVYTALITPFQKNGNLDEEGLRQNIRFQIESKVAGIVALGTTGETPTLTETEEKRIIKIAIEEAKNKIQVLIGTGTNSTLKTIEKTKRARDEGADGVLIVTPYYNKPTQRGLIEHFKAIEREAQFPFLTYNVPGRSSCFIETATLKEISKLPHCLGVKDATGSISNMSEVIEAINQHNPKFQVLSGDDALTLPLISLGGTGVISVASNLIPKEVVQLVEQALWGEMLAAKALHHKLSPLFKALFCETNPIPIKQAMEWMEMPAGGVRLPLYEMSDANKQILKVALEETTFHIPKPNGKDELSEIQRSGSRL